MIFWIIFYIICVAALIGLAILAKVAIEEKDNGSLVFIIIATVIISFDAFLSATEFAAKNVRTKSLPQIETVIKTKIVDNKAVSDTTYIYHF